MADDTKRSDLDLGPEEAGVAFRLEMFITDVLLRWWKHIAALVGLVLLGLLVYGQYQSIVRNSQRATSASIADVEAAMSQDLGELAMMRAGGGGAAKIDAAEVSESADKLMKIAESGSGPARIEALLKAAELYRIADNAAGRRKALEGAATDATGVLRFAALSGLATVDLEEGKTEDALGRYRDLQREDEFLARKATLLLASTLEAISRPADAAKAYDDYLARWPEASDKEEVQSRRDKAAGQGG